MAIPVINVELDHEPHDRWSGLREHRDAARDMVALYLDDLGGLEEFGDLLEAYVAGLVEPELRAELEAVAGILGVAVAEVALVNLYYDAIKVVVGCTAFAVDTPQGPIHARNLDWMSRDGTLERHTVVNRYLRRGEHVFSTVGWPGYIGALSGVAPGRFSITLNAVLSDDPAIFAPPVSFLIRRVLEGTGDFATAVKTLSETEIACDCLLMVVGVQRGEFVVVERTPTRSAQRRTDGGVLVVTNDYRSLAETGSGDGSGDLLSTSCGRFDRASSLVARYESLNPESCFAVLNDEAVRMGITVQQMVFRAATAEMVVRRPAV